MHVTFYTEQNVQRAMLKCSPFIVLEEFSIDTKVTNLYTKPPGTSKYVQVAA